MESGFITGIILAGGKATRMGEPCDKAFLKINGEPIIDIQSRILKKVFGKIMIVTNSFEGYKDLEGVTLVSDTVLGLGPLCGIYSGLIASGSFYNFIVACDMPYINEPLIRYMAQNKDGYDAVVPKTDDKLHPLFGVYSKNCIPVITELIEQGDFHVRSIFPRVKTRFLLKAEMEKFDEGLLSLVNVNSRKDYEACLSGR